MSGTPDWQKERVRAYFQGTNEKSYLAHWSPDALAFHFGLSNASTASLAEAQLAANAYLADRLDIGAGTRVLDAGCGVGGTAIWLAKARGARVTGVTLDPRQAELAAGFADARGVADKVSFHVLDYAATGLPEASFDVVLNLESLCHAIDVDAYLDHARALLADGGRYGCLDFYTGNASQELLDVVRTGWAMPRWCSMPEIEAKVRQAFDDVVTEDLSAEVRRSAEQMRAMAENTALIAKLDRAVGAAAPDPLYEGHVKAAIACCNGLLEGGITYGYVGGRRPRR